MDLKIRSGLPLSLEDGKIALSGGAVSLPASYRQPEEAKPYFMDKDADFGPVCLAGESVAGRPGWLYEMARGVRFEKDKEIFEKNGLRYDITNIRPGTVGGEFIKTIGHFHRDLSSEVYEVLSGEALFLFQEVNSGKVFLIKAESGEKVLIPAGFGHITINPGKENLVVSDISSVDMDPDYEFFKKNRGAAYYITELRIKNYELRIENGVAAVKNINYPKMGELKIGRPREIPELGISFSEPLYGSFIENPGKFDFIRNPGKYEKIMSPENLFDFSGQ